MLNTSRMMIKVLLFFIAQQFSSFAFAEAPGRVSYFSASSYNIYAGGSTFLSWGKPSGVSWARYYNFSVKKADGSPKFVKLRNTMSQSFNHTINMLGTHIFDIQACNSSGQCDAESSLNVTVSNPPPVVGSTSSPIISNSQQLTHNNSGVN